MVLTTERLIIRPFREADFEAVHEYASDESVTRYTSFGPNTPEETREFIARCQGEMDELPRQHYNLAITLRGEDLVIGGVGFNIDNPRHSGTELGYVLHKEYWGRGIAAEAAASVVQYAFDVVKLHRIIARCHPDNPASEAVMRKIGMTYEGRQREVMWMKGAWWDFLVYSILDWEFRGDVKRET